MMFVAERLVRRAIRESQIGITKSVATGVWDTSLI